MLLTREELAALHTRLREQQVLSVYLAAAVSNPAEHGARQVLLGKEFAAIRQRLEGVGREERAAFERAAAHLEAALHGVRPGEFGWVAFATPEGVQFHGALPAEVGTLLRWQQGIWATPYIRTLKQNRPVVVAVVDSTSADIYRYHAGELERVAHVEVHPHGGHADHLGALPREGFHPGTRGSTATDLASRSRVVARERVVADVAAKLREVGAEHQYILVGGAAATTAALRDELSSHAVRVLVVPEIKRRTSLALLRRLAAVGASQLRAADESTMISTVAERVGAHGTGVAGAAATLNALAAGQVRTLLVTEEFVDANAAEADRAIALALDSNADVELVTGPAAEQLEQVAGGIAAQLRFVAHPAPPLTMAT